LDLQDRIESWNSQMEVMYAQPRWQVVGRSLSEVFQRHSSRSFIASGKIREFTIFTSSGGDAHG